MYLNIEPTWLRFLQRFFNPGPLSIFQSYPIGFFYIPLQVIHIVSPLRCLRKDPCRPSGEFSYRFLSSAADVQSLTMPSGLASQTPSSFFFFPPLSFILSPSPWLMQRSKCTSSCRFLGFVRNEFSRCSSHRSGLIG